MDLQSLLPTLLPSAIACAEAQAARGIQARSALSQSGEVVARKVGVSRPDLVRIAVVDALPMPEDPMLRAAALQTGLLGPGIAGLTLGYAVFVWRGQETWRLLAHELRHVFQYEQAGSIAQFLPVYLGQIAQYGYSNAPLEQDARQFEAVTPDSA